MAKIREGHVPIPPVGYIVVGAGVAIYSLFVKGQNPEYTAMTLFFWVGVILAIIGLGKLLLGREKNIEVVDEKKEQVSYQQQLARQRQQWQQQRQQHAQTPAQHNIIACPRCKTANWTSSSFCHKCGAPLS